jgi:hypothetical protein
MSGAAADLVIVDELAEKTSDEADLVHMYCETNENLALCGRDLTGAPFANEFDESDICVVCDDLLVAETCVICGKDHD